jgi:hypothetical protein
MYLAVSALYPIHPTHIDTSSQEFKGAFHYFKMDRAAAMVARVARRHGSFNTFRSVEVMNECAIGGLPWENCSYQQGFHHLVQDGFIVAVGTDEYRVTHEFIARCFVASPEPTFVRPALAEPVSSS